MRLVVPVRDFIFDDELAVAATAFPFGVDLVAGAKAFPGLSLVGSGFGGGLVDVEALASFGGELATALGQLCAFVNA
jgi:hypothetical protein